MTTDQSKVQTYIVFQGSNYKEEYASGFLWAPCYDGGGKEPHHWKRLTKLKPGDRVFHYSKGCIRAISTVTSQWVHSDRRPEIDDDEERYREGRMVECDTLVLDTPILVSKYKDAIIKYRSEEFSAFNKYGGANRGYLYELEPELATLFEKEAGIIIPTVDVETLPEEIVEEPEKPIIEGAKKTITVNSDERDPRAKQICKDHYMKLYGRVACQVCGFDFGKEYGPDFANKIHIHHIIPLSNLKEEYMVDPIKHLIPVCPNCHMVLHSGSGMTIEELKKRIKNKGKG